jgi:hypothetical protein
MAVTTQLIFDADLATADLEFSTSGLLTTTFHYAADTISAPAIPANATITRTDLVLMTRSVHELILLVNRRFQSGAVLNPDVVLWAQPPAVLSSWQIDLESDRGNKRHMEGRIGPAATELRWGVDYSPADSSVEIKHRPAFEVSLVDFQLWDHVSKLFLWLALGEQIIGW